MKAAPNGKKVFLKWFTETHAQVQKPRGEILPGSPALFPVLFLCEKPVLFKYNGGVKETAAPVRQTLHHCDTESNDNKLRKLKPQKRSLHLLFSLVPLLWKCLTNEFLKIFKFVYLKHHYYHQSSAESYTPRLPFWNTCSLHVTRMSPSTFVNLSSFLSVWLASKAEFTTRKQVNKIEKSVLSLDWV